MRVAEFDQYAENYQAGMEHPLKRWLGPSRESYLICKTDWIHKQLLSIAIRMRVSLSDMDVLEVGCGDGALLRAMRTAGFGGALHGCDVSAQMIPPKPAENCNPGRISFCAQTHDDALPFDTSIIPGTLSRGSLSPALGSTQTPSCCLRLRSAVWSARWERL